MGKTADLAMVQKMIVDTLHKAVGISLRLQGKLGFPYNVKKWMVKYVLLC